MLVDTTLPLVGMVYSRHLPFLNVASLSAMGSLIHTVSSDSTRAPAGSDLGVGTIHSEVLPVLGSSRASLPVYSSGNHTLPFESKSSRPGPDCFVGTGYSRNPWSRR